MAGAAAHLLSSLVFVGLFLVASFLITRIAFRNRRVGRFIGQIATFVGFTIILFLAGVIPTEPIPTTHHTLTYLAIGLFKIIWWLAGAWLLVGFFRAMVFLERQPSETRFLQDLFAGIVYVCAVLAIISYVFDIPIQGLLAASGVVAIVLGLALWIAKRKSVSRCRATYTVEALRGTDASPSAASCRGSAYAQAIFGEPESGTRQSRRKRSGRDLASTTRRDGTTPLSPTALESSTPER